MTAPASAQTAAVKLPAAVAASGPCGDGNGYNGANRFWRCTGSSATSQWVASTSCDQGEYNAITYDPSREAGVIRRDDARFRVPPPGMITALGSHDRLPVPCGSR